MGKGGQNGQTFRCKINTLWGCNAQHGVLAQLLSYVRLLETPWTIAHQAPLSMEFARQECWSGVSFPTPGDLPNPGIEPVSPASPALAAGFSTTLPPGKPCEHS